MQAHKMIFRDKSYYVATLMRLTCVFSFVVRLSRHSNDEFAFDTEYRLSQHCLLNLCLHCLS